MLEKRSIQSIGAQEILIMSRRLKKVWEGFRMKPFEQSFSNTHRGNRHIQSLTSKSMEVLMYLAIAVETKQHPRLYHDYRVWYLEINSHGQVIGVGVKTKEELIQNLFENYQNTGKSNWRAFKKDAEKSTPIEIYDFVSMNMHENTHFGNLPTLSEFQNVLDTLESGLELRSIAS